MIEVKKRIKKEHFQNSINKLVERGKIDTSNTQIHDHLFFWTGSSNTKWRGQASPMGPKFCYCRNVIYVI